MQDILEVATIHTQTALNYTSPEADILQYVNHQITVHFLEKIDRIYLESLVYTIMQKTRHECAI